MKKICPSLFPLALIILLWLTPGCKKGSPTTVFNSSSSAIVTQDGVVLSTAQGVVQAGGRVTPLITTNYLGGLLSFTIPIDNDPPATNGSFTIGLSNIAPVGQGNDFATGDSIPLDLVNSTDLISLDFTNYFTNADGRKDLEIFYFSTLNPAGAITTGYLLITKNDVEARRLEGILVCELPEKSHGGSVHVTCQFFISY